MPEGTRRQARSTDTRAQLVVPVGVVITCVWAASAFVGLLTGVYTGIEIVSPVMVIFVSYVFGINIIRSGDKIPDVPSSAASAGPSPSRRRKT